jgi:hypothetical protein
MRTRWTWFGADARTPAATGSQAAKAPSARDGLFGLLRRAAFGYAPGAVQPAGVLHPLRAGRLGCPSPRRLRIGDNGQRSASSSGMITDLRRRVSRNWRAARPGSQQGPALRPSMVVGAPRELKEPLTALHRQARPAGDEGVPELGVGEPSRSRVCRRRRPRCRRRTSLPRPGA